jgi:AcrR family transcriptional regulator
VSDDEVFAAAHRAMSRLAPHELTLAEVAAEAGVTAGALVQRFGSKRDLLLRLAESAAGFTPLFFAQLKKKHRSPLAAVRDYAECFAQMAPSPAALARSLAYLQIDVTDDDFRRPLLRQYRETRAELEHLLAAAVTARELRKDTDTRALARTIECIVSGALLTWAIYAEGSARKWMRDVMDAVLAPHRRATR